jgi:hypothetical protein
MFLIATWCNYDKKFNYFVVANLQKRHPSWVPCTIIKELAGESCRLNVEKY